MYTLYYTMQFTLCTQHQTLLSAYTMTVRCAAVNCSLYLVYCVQCTVLLYTRTLRTINPHTLHYKPTHFALHTEPCALCIVHCLPVHWALYTCTLKFDIDKGDHQPRPWACQLSQDNSLTSVPCPLLSSLVLLQWTMDIINARISTWSCTMSDLHILTALINYGGGFLSMKWQFQETFQESLDNLKVIIF